MQSIPQSRLNMFATPSKFDIVEALSGLHGPIIEIGGPSPNYEAPIPSLVEIEAATGKRVYIANILNMAGVDIRLDVRKLPIADNSLGAIMARGLPRDVRMAFIDQASRALKPGGLILNSIADETDMAYALAAGFAIMDCKSYETEEKQLFRKLGSLANDWQEKTITCKSFSFIGQK